VPTHSRTTWWHRWPEGIGYAAGSWSLTYGALGLYWALGGAGFPYGFEHDPAAHLSVLANVRPEGAAPFIAALGLVGAVVAGVMARAWGRGVARAALVAFAWAVAVWLALLIPDFRLLVVVAYAPILLIGAPFGWPEGVRFSDAVPWPVLNQVVCIGGGLLWAAAAVAYQRRTRVACGHCGRADDVVTWTTPAAAARWGNRAVSIAVIVPVVYALTRWAWALGIPFGITEKFFREGQAIGLWWRGAALATVAIGGAMLTYGLIQPWGEVFPRWLPFLARKPVPRALVIIPAALVAVIVTTAGLMFFRLTLSGDFRLGDNPINFEENLGALAPELLWPFWGAALSAATLAYYYRTRGRCKYCGRL
jgi:hypothetical protein